MNDIIKNELNKYTKYADVRNSILFNVLASFKPEEIDDKIANAKEILKDLEHPISIPTLIDEVEKNIKVYDECATACRILTWVTDELEKDTDKVTEEDKNED